MTKLHFLALLIIIGLLLTSTGAVFGYGVLGATDLMVTPSTVTLSPNSVGFSLNISEGNNTHFNLDYGLLPGLEVGLSVNDWDYGETFVTVRGKYRLLRETASSPALAVGVQDVGEKDIDISPYLVISKNLEPDLGIDGYLGVGGGEIDGIFGGVSKTFRISEAQREGSNLSQIQLILEFDSDNLNFASRFQIGSRAKVNFGFYDMEKWMIGITYTT